MNNKELYERARQDAFIRIRMASDPGINYLRDYSEFKKPDYETDAHWLSVCTKKILAEYAENKKRRLNGTKRI